MRNIRGILLGLVIACILSVGAGALVPAPVGAADTAPVRYDRFDVDFVIDQSGDFRITERQAVNFLSGSYRRASRNIGLANTQEIKDITVSEDGRAYTLATNAAAQSPNTYTTRNNGATLTIEWYFPQTSGQVRNFEIAYTVVGGLRINPDLDVLDWVALRQDLPASALASTVTVRLPSAIDQAQFRLDSLGAPARREVVDGRTAQFVATNGVPRGEGLAIKVAFPHGLVSAAPPPWQQAFDQQQREQERRQGIQDLANLALGVLGILVLLGGGLLLFILWYMRGRDPHVGLMADYLREPPSDLSPGVMGTLIDERADLHDVLGTLTDLGRKGIIHIEEVAPAQGSWGRSDFLIERREAGIPLTKLEQAVLDTILPNGAIRMRLSEVKGGINASLTRFNEALYAEVVERGYFTVSPERTRQRYRTAGKAMAILAIVVAVGAFFISGSTLGALIFPAIGLVVIGLALRGMARAMPVKTRLGAEEAARWNAFKRYLANLEKYENLNEAKGRFEQFLPYATAFGLDQSFIQKFASVAAPVPQWFGGGGGFGGPVIIDTGGGHYGPHHHGGGGYYGPMSMGGGGGGGGGDNGGGGGGWGIPSLDDLSNRGGGGLDSMSGSLADMLSSAASVFGGGGGGSDGGWSGGGGGFDFGGGGGGGDSGGGGDFG